MFKNTYQSGFISILYAGGSKPLSIWEQTVKNGHIRRVTDEDVQTLALEISGTNVATTYILCPKDRKETLGIRLPFFVMIVKNMKKYFTFEIQILDDKNMSRRFRVSNYQSTTRVRPFSTSLPIGLTGGWNQIQFNLADFTRRAYGSSYLETLRVQIHANVRIRRIYFSDRLYAEDEMPQEFKLYMPIAKQKYVNAAKDVKAKENKSIEKDAKRPSFRMSTNLRQEEEIPSGAPPTPADVGRIEESIIQVVVTEPEEQPAPDIQVQESTVSQQSEVPQEDIKDVQSVLETEEGDAVLPQEVEDGVLPQEVEDALAIEISEPDMNQKVDKDDVEINEVVTDTETAPSEVDASEVDASEVDASEVEASEVDAIEVAPSEAATEDFTVEDSEAEPVTEDIPE